MKFLKTLFGNRSEKAEEHPFTALPQPKQPLIVIGDVHGMAGLLDRLLGKIESKAAQIVFVGDLIDRGEDSAAVLNRVQEQCGKGAVCLRGNHEQMMLDFLDDPVENGRRWLRNGGLQTLMSFGVGGVTPTSGSAELNECRDQLVKTMPKGQLEWLKALPLSYVSGNVHIVHAAADPAIPMALQSENTLLWGNGDFRHKNRTDGQLVVHGHTIVDFPTYHDGVISVDTGAFATAKLTAAMIEENQVEFVQA